MNFCQLTVSSLVKKIGCCFTIIMIIVFIYLDMLSQFPTCWLLLRYHCRKKIHDMASWAFNIICILYSALVSNAHGVNVHMCFLQFQERHLLLTPTSAIKLLVFMSNAFMFVLLSRNDIILLSWREMHSCLSCFKKCRHSSFSKAQGMYCCGGSIRLLLWIARVFRLFAKKSSFAICWHIERNLSTRNGILLMMVHLLQAWWLKGMSIIVVTRLRSLASQRGCSVNEWAKPSAMSLV